MKIYTFFLLAIFWILNSCTISDKEPWTEIYNSKDMNGWEIRDGVAEAWIEQGLLVTEQTDSLNFPYLVYTEEFSDFILECWVKLTGPLNSGILIRANSNPQINNGKIHGFQMEIDQTERRWTGGIYEEAGRKWLTPLKGMGEGEQQALNAYKVSDWNHYRIEAISDTFEIWVNGITTTQLIDSKTQSGIIGFQIHKIGPDTEKGILRIKSAKVLKENPARYCRKMALPAKIAE